MARLNTIGARPSGPLALFGVVWMASATSSSVIGSAQCFRAHSHSSLLALGVVGLHWLFVAVALWAVIDKVSSWRKARGERICPGWALEQSSGFAPLLDPLRYLW